MDLVELNKSRLEDDECERMYFKFSTTDAVVDLYHLIRLVISEIMLEIVAEVKDECANRIKYDKSTVDARIKEMFHSYIRSAREPLDRFQTEMKRIFRIPKAVPLYKTVNIVYSKKDIMKLREHISQVEVQLVKEEAFIVKCTQLKDMVLPNILDNVKKIRRTMQATLELEKKLNKKAMKEIVSQQLLALRSFLNDDDNEKLLSLELSRGKYNLVNLA